MVLPSVPCGSQAAQRSAMQYRSVALSWPERRYIGHFQATKRCGPDAASLQLASSTHATSSAMIGE
jgi:hypothetical protein